MQVPLPFLPFPVSSLVLCPSPLPPKVTLVSPFPFSRAVYPHPHPLILSFSLLVTIFSPSYSLVPFPPLHSFPLLHAVTPPFPLLCSTRFTIHPLYRSSSCTPLILPISSAVTTLLLPPPLPSSPLSSRPQVSARLLSLHNFSVRLFAPDCFPVITPRRHTMSRAWLRLLPGMSHKSPFIPHLPMSTRPQGDTS